MSFEGCLFMSSAVAASGFSSASTLFTELDEANARRKARLRASPVLVGVDDPFLLEQASDRIFLSDPVHNLLDVTREAISAYLYEKRLNRGKGVTKAQVRLLELWSANASRLTELLGSSSNSEFAYLANPDTVRALKKKALENGTV